MYQNELRYAEIIILQMNYYIRRDDNNLSPDLSNYFHYLRIGVFGGLIGYLLF